MAFNPYVAEYEPSPELLAEMHMNQLSKQMVNSVLNNSMPFFSCAADQWTIERAIAEGKDSLFFYFLMNRLFEEAAMIYESQIARLMNPVPDIRRSNCILKYALLVQALDSIDNKLKLTERRRVNKLIRWEGLPKSVYMQVYPTRGGKRTRKMRANRRKTRR